ncbi:MAG: hypothetical protein CMP13_09245, partial [Zunongwangia sp.]|nr:hypothetical protein [Zunongwangia sp.]
SIKFWKAMEKIEVSRSLFLSKKFESSKAVVHEQSFKIQHSKVKINSPASWILILFSFLYSKYK